MKCDMILMKTQVLTAQRNNMDYFYSFKTKSTFFFLSNTELQDNVIYQKELDLQNVSGENSVLHQGLSFFWVGKKKLKKVLNGYTGF